MNHYDDVQINVRESLNKSLAESNWDASVKSGSLGIFEAPLNYLKLLFFGGLQHFGIWQRFVRANLVLGWFSEFREFWEQELKNRRLELPDYYYLRGLYRQKFQRVTVPTGADTEDFLAAWQRPETLGLLFTYIYKLALNPVMSYTTARFIPFGAKVCEFGCGLAPVTRDLNEYFAHRRLQLHAVDIPTVLLYYTSWKFRTVPYVNVSDIDPHDVSPLEDSYDVITCLTVFEHLSKPLEIAQHFHTQLKSDGRLIFDYRRTEGTGLDTAESAAQRQQTLAFIEENFKVVQGKIDSGQDNFGLVVAVKKNA